jgi:hypothetical protein
MTEAEKTSEMYLLLVMKKGRRRMSSMCASLQSLFLGRSDNEMGLNTPETISSKILVSCPQEPATRLCINQTNRVHIFI